MKEQIKQVKEFNKAFGIKDVSPRLRYRLIKEELIEYFEASYIEYFDESYIDNIEDDSLNLDIDKVEQADAIGDMLYLVFGAVIDAGLEDKIDAIFDEIHRSNMSKLENGKPIYREDGKVEKGKDYFKPNIKAILDK